MERLWNRNYNRVMAANFALFFAFYLLTPLLPLYLSERFGATKDVIGLVLSGYTLAALLSRPVSGYLVDTLPRRRVLLWCFGLFTVFFGGYLVGSSLLLFALVRTLHGAPFGALTVANSTVAIDVLPPSRRSEGIGYYGLSNNLAMAISPSVGVYVYHATGNFEVLFWLALAIAAAGFVIDAGVRLPVEAGGRLRPAPTGTSSTAPDASPTAIAREEAPFVPAEACGIVATPALPASRRRRLAVSLGRFFLLRGWLLALNMTFFGFCFGVLSNYLAIYGRDVMGITGGTGTYFLLLAVGLILSRLQGTKALRQGRLTLNATEGTLLSTGGYLCFVLLPNEVGYYLSALLIGLGNGHMWPAFQNMMIALARPNRRGTANSSILVSWDVGIGLGVLVGGFVAEHFGYRTAFWGVALAQAAGAATWIAFTRQFFLKRRLE